MAPSRALRGVTVMGGCESARGNASRAAEFNFHADPEAAHIVFEAFTPQVLSLTLFQFT
ncbi:hypothetical protein T484DRAFT_1860135 [Baffinella frigidus]|nr:hypothetical protein T484DRAFT_1860135 [Cryptophyta sp. CCMP2293]